MSKDLPLWKDDESDVKAEYRLNLGHMLLHTTDMERVLKKIQSIFKVGKPLFVSDSIKAEDLPKDNMTGVTLLNDSDHWHFILANFESNIAIFAPHFLFNNSTNWIKLSRKLQVAIASVHQLDIDSFGYTVFMKGKRICSAHRDQSGIHQSKMVPMEFYLDGKLIYKADDEKDQFAEDTLKFISEDALIEIDGQGQVQFKVPLSKDEFHKPESIRHVVFECQSYSNMNVKKNRKLLLKQIY